MNRNKKILNVTMAAGMAAVLGTTPVIAAAQEADNGVSKEETVYVLADSTGKERKVIVSAHLINDENKDTIEDASTLKDIENVKGDETFKQDGSKLNSMCLKI